MRSWLRASVVVEGRSVTFYEEVHPQRLLANYQVHKRFVKRLAQLLPPCRQAPIILTDAGFRTTWFKLIAQQGWHWIGRIRNREFVCPKIKGEWGPAKALYADASDTAEDLGLYQSARSNLIDCRLVRYKAKPKGRKHRYASGKEKRNSQTKKLSARQSEWVLNSQSGIPRAWRWGWGYARATHTARNACKPCCWWHILRNSRCVWLACAPKRSSYTYN